jgi:N-acyl homoserine lactone hydrolase
MNIADPIRRVSVVSTGQVQIRPEHEASNWRPMAWWLVASRRWTGPRPINAYVIEHRDGLVLFDSGQDRASVTDPGYFPGGVTGVLYGRLARFQIGPRETLSAGLDRLGYAAGDVGTAVLSHLHQDHIGGLAELPDADIVVSQAEWDTLSSPLPEMRGLMRRHIDLPGLRWHRIKTAPTDDAGLAPFRSCHDLFGDGSLVLLPTPGHTPGSMSLLVRRPGLPPLMMVGDLTYDAHLLEAGQVPGVGSRRRLREATAMVNQMRQQYPGLVILPAHDPGAADRLARVPLATARLCRSNATTAGLGPGRVRGARSRLASSGGVPALVASRRGTRAVSSAGERFPDTEEVTSSNLVRPTSFFENLSSAGSQKGSQAPAGLPHRCWSEHHTLQPELGDCLRLGVLSGDRRDAAVIIPTRSNVAAGECLSALHGASRRSGPVAVVAEPKPRRASRTPGSGLVVMTRGSVSVVVVVETAGDDSDHVGLDVVHEPVLLGYPA